MSLKVYNEDQLVDIPDKDLKNFERIAAAGGIVLNEKGEILMIFRRGKWDLPKGKLEGNEPIELCAEREIKEETGITELVLQRFLLTTYHQYKEKKQNILKDTHWYLFHSPGSQELNPQTIEDISKAVWVKPEDLSECTANTYELIKDVLKEAGFANVSIH